MDSLEYIKNQVLIIMNFYNSKRYEDVILKGKPLIKKYPDQVIFYNAVALSLSALGFHEEALKILNKALKLNSNKIFVLNNIGLVNANKNNNKLAREYFEKALKINENFIDALVNLSNLSLKENKADEAKFNLLKALKLSQSKQSDEIINMTLGQLFQQTGDFNEAINYFEAVSKINQNNTIVDQEISMIHKYKNKNDNHFISMKKKEDFIENKNDLKNLYFALGKAHEDLNEFENSFNYIKKANNIANSEMKYDINKDKELFLNIKKFFTNYNKTRKFDCPKKFIFIVGMPRSGTTLVEQIISAHPDIYGAGELVFLGENITKTLIEDNKFIFETINELDNEKLIKIQTNYIDQTNIFTNKLKFLTDKAPLNFRWIGFIKILFPDSKIIHCHRDAMDVCFSNFKNSFAGKSLPFTYSLEDLATYYNLYKDLMNFWNKIYTNEILNQSYENLVENQEKETKNLISYCGLDWNEACLKPQENKKIVATASLSQIRSPIYKSSVKKWKNFEAQLKELKQKID